MLPYFHPILAALVLALLGYVAALGLRSRSDRRNRAKWLRQHARIAPWMYAAVVATWTAGVAGQWWTRPASELAASPHFRVGVALVVVLGAGALSSRWMNVSAARAAHPWFGALAILLAAVQVVFGLQLLP
jgi:uncharacterized membrane protein SirB2